MSSPSSRRAWIEIAAVSCIMPQKAVALLAEGVDRNFPQPELTPLGDTSPSSRRAWIEIAFLVYTARNCPESPSTRRAWIAIGCV